MVPRLWTAHEYHANLLAPVGETVIGMERTGIPVDLAVLRDIYARMTERADELRRELHDWCPRDINWASWQQLAEWFHGTWEEEVADRYLASQVRSEEHTSELQSR